MTILLAGAAAPNPLAEAVSALVREAAASELELAPGEIEGMVEAEIGLVTEGILAWWARRKQHAAEDRTPLADIAAEGSFDSARQKANMLQSLRGRIRRLSGNIRQLESRLEYEEQHLNALLSPENFPKHTAEWLEKAQHREAVYEKRPEREVEGYKEAIEQHRANLKDHQEWLEKAEAIPVRHAPQP